MKNTVGIVAISAVVVVGLLFIACGSGGGASKPDEGDHEENRGEHHMTVELSDNLFRPDTVQVHHGEMLHLRLENTGQAIHNLRFAGPDGKYMTADDPPVLGLNRILRPGEAAEGSYFFDDLGVYAFRCDFHAEMTGTLRVTDDHSGDDHKHGDDHHADLSIPKKG